MYVSSWRFSAKKQQLTIRKFNYVCTSLFHENIIEVKYTGNFLLFLLPLLLKINVTMANQSKTSTIFDCMIKQ